MLKQKYGSDGFEGMRALFADNSVGSIYSFMYYLNGTYYTDEKTGETKLNLDDSGKILNGRSAEKIFAYDELDENNQRKGSSTGFFGELANYKY